MIAANAAIAATTVTVVRPKVWVVTGCSLTATNGRSNAARALMVAPGVGWVKPGT
jgi:hypothetical protein